jgi:hypothetical protein
MRLNALTIALGVNLAAAGALAWLWSDADRSRWVEPVALPPAIEDVIVAPASELSDVSRYRETLERPLFASSRRIAPRAPASAEAQEAVDPLKDVRLLGTYGAGDRGGIVVVRGGKLERIAVGARIGDWKVTGEEGRGAALVRANGERRKLELALNTATPSLPAGAGKAGGPSDAAQVPAASTVAAGQRDPRPAQPSPAAATPVMGQTDEVRQRLERERTERINARRAKRGLPPVTTQ